MLLKGNLKRVSQISVLIYFKTEIVIVAVKLEKYPNK